MDEYSVANKVGSFAINVGQKNAMIAGRRVYKSGPLQLTEHYPEGIQDANHPLFKQYHPNELVGLDLFLADQNNRGRGLGVRILSYFIQGLPPNIRAIIVDPDATNHQAIRCYEKAGFERTDYSEDENYLLLLKR